MNFFNGKEAFGHAVKLSFPRYADSRGEEEALNYIKENLQKTGWKLREEEFFIPLTPTPLFRLILSGILFIVIFFGFFAPSLPFLASAFYFLSFLFLLFSFRVWLSLIHSDFYHRKKGSKKSKNLIAFQEKKDLKKKKVFLVAHHDSKSQSLSLPFRAIITLFLSVSLILSAFLCFLYGLKSYGLLEIERFYFYLNISNILSVCTLLLLIVNRTENKSPGSMDNASGVGVLLELGQILIKHPLKNLDIHLLFTGAEEEGLIGASAFIKNNEIELNKEDIFLNIDSVSDKKVFVSLNRKKEKDLLDVIKNVSKEQGEKIFFLSLPGFLMDHLSFSFRGYRALSLYTVSKKSLNIHTMKDNSSLLDLGRIRKTGQFLERIIRILDGERLPVKVNAYSGYRGEEIPRSFVHEEKQHEIEEVLSMTTEENKKRKVYRKFLVRTREGIKYTLLYDEESGEWSLLFQKKIP
jgi:hypothetical protein